MILVTTIGLDAAKAQRVMENGLGDLTELALPQEDEVKAGLNRLETEGTAAQRIGMGKI